MTFSTMTKIFLTLLALLGVYEIVAILNSVPGDTISELTWSILQYPVVTFLSGFVSGHLFWQSKLFHKPKPNDHE